MRDFFGLDDDFVREAPPRAWVSDAVVAAVTCGITILGLVMWGGSPDVIPPDMLWPSIGLTLLAGIFITLRRIFPITMFVALTGFHFILAGELAPFVATMATMQVVYFLGLYSAMAWAKQRQALLFATLAVLLAMTIWLVIDLQDQVQMFTQNYGANPALYTVFSVVVNIAFFGAALWLGRNAWLQAKSQAELEESHAIIERQAGELAGKAVVDERLRIARELHDSVAHHVALMGVQASAARRVMEKKPEQALDAIRSVENESRKTVQELKNAVGSLRAPGDASETRTDLASLKELYADLEAMGLCVDATTVGDPSGLSPSVSTALYRVVQESLNNVRKHSTANKAKVTIRVEPNAAEVEVLDSGGSLPDTRGSGVGHVGIRERINALGGTVQIGPRLERGYRVLARIPLEDE